MIVTGAAELWGSSLPLAYHRAGSQRLPAVPSGGSSWPLKALALWLEQSCGLEGTGAAIAPSPPTLLPGGEHLAEMLDEAAEYLASQERSKASYLVRPRGRSRQ